MGIREKINENPAITTGATAAIVVVALAFVIWQTLGSSPRPLSSASLKAFFSDDDGKTWYTDDASLVPPYDHNGKQAVSAVVYQDSNGPYCVYLKRYPAAIKQKLELVAQHQPVPGMFGGGGVDELESSFEVKRPGDTRWIPNSNPMASQITFIRPRTASGGAPVPANPQQQPQ